MNSLSQKIAALEVLTTKSRKPPETHIVKLMGNAEHDACIDANLRSLGLEGHVLRPKLKACSWN